MTVPPGADPPTPARPAPPMAWVRELARLVVPVACPGCGRADVRCCPACAATLQGPLLRVEFAAPRLDRLDGVPPLPVWALARYAEEVRELVVAWKDHGRVDLDRLLAPALGRAAGEIAATVGAAAGGRPLLVVPAPSTGASRRGRGREHLAPLAMAVVHGLRRAGATARVAPALRRRRGRDQVGLGARDRGRNLAGTVVVRRRALPGGTAPAACVLVDDVVTTGATLAAAERALEAAGADVVAALVVAATPPPGRRRTGTRPPPPAVYRARENGLA